MRIQVPLSKHYAKNVLLVLRRDYDEARSATGQLLLISRDNGFPHWIALTTILHGVALELSSSEEEGVGAIEDGLQSLAAIGWQQFRPFYLCTASLVDMGRGNFDIGSHRLNEALACVGVTEECWAESEVHRCLGDIALRRRDDRQRSERAYLQALNLARAQSAKSWELRAATSLARLWHVQGRRAEAHDLLAPVYGWFTEGLETLDLKEARALLDELA